MIYHTIACYSLLLLTNLRLHHPQCHPIHIWLRFSASSCSDINSDLYDVYACCCVVQSLRISRTLLRLLTFRFTTDYVYAASRHRILYLHTFCFSSEYTTQYQRDCPSSSFSVVRSLVPLIHYLRVLGHAPPRAQEVAHSRIRSRRSRRTSSSHAAFENRIRGRSATPASVLRPHQRPSPTTSNFQSKSPRNTQRNTMTIKGSDVLLILVRLSSETLR